MQPEFIEKSTRYEKRTKIELFEDSVTWQMARELTRKIIERRGAQNGELRTCKRLR